MSKPERVISTASGVMAIGVTLFVVMLFGTLFSFSYRSECVREPETGKRSCTDHLEFLGWAGLPLQPLASAIGVGAGAFIAFKKAKSPSEVVEMLAGNDDVSGTN